MDTREPIYRKICADCDRPALTLDHAGHAYCGEHADVFIAIGETPIGEAELSILLIHRPHVTAVG